MSTVRTSLALVGGGLANGLIALAALAIDPRRTLVLVESTGEIGGNHTWSAHPGDLPESARAWIEPLLEHRWPGYEVRFPGLERTLGGEYAAISSARFTGVVRRAVERAHGSRILLGRRAVEIGERRVTLDDGTIVEAALVVDARGPAEPAPAASCGYQKFLGLEIAFAKPHGLERPILMDALVPQSDGFRFFYVLPLAPDRLLVEDTCFSLRPDLDRGRIANAVLDYAGRFGSPGRIVREETGVLPMPWAGSAPAPPRRSPLRAGYGGGWFHPATGYSLPIAIRLAEHVAAREPSAVFDARLERLHREHVSQARFAEWLNRLLFRAFAPEDAWTAFARFYTLPEKTIRRFYSMSLTLGDRARLLVGRPPSGFSLRRALTQPRAA